MSTVDVDVTLTDVHAVEEMVRPRRPGQVSSEDLTSLYSGVDHGELAQRWLDRGPSVVVVTYGPDGCVAYTRQTATRVAAPAVDVVDTIGAGDSFLSGMLWSLGTQATCAERPVGPSSRRSCVGLSLSPWRARPSPSAAPAPIRRTSARSRPNLDPHAT
jgi:fructokinase